MPYEPPIDLARRARHIAEDVTAVLDSGNLSLAPHGPIGSLATAIEVLAKAVEQLARKQNP